MLYSYLRALIFSSNNRSHSIRCNNDIMQCMIADIAILSLSKSHSWLLESQIKIKEIIVSTNVSRCHRNYFSDYLRYKSRLIVQVKTNEKSIVIIYPGIHVDYILQLQSS